MERVALPGGGSLAVEDLGSGAPVVLLHTGFVARGMRPLMAQPALAGGRRLVGFHRRGYGESDPAGGPVSMAEQAGDVLAVMDHAGLTAAHLVGHSLGATIALEVALAAPDRVRSLTLLEPLLGFALSPETAQFITDTAAVALPRYAAGDREGAVRAWLTGAFGEGFREVLDATLPGGFEQAVHDADAPFGRELPALQAWSRGPDDLRSITARSLSVVNTGAAWPGFRETHEALLDWLPNSEGAAVPARSHLLQIEDPGLIAGVVADFLARVG